MLTDGRIDGRTDRLTDGQRIGRLYRTRLQAGAIKTSFDLKRFNKVLHTQMLWLPFAHR